MGSKTIFGDFRQHASSVYRVTTEASVYIVGFHEDRGRPFVVVRGLPGTDREHVVLRDSDPQIGDDSMFELPPRAWVGKTMRVATMTSSAITRAAAEDDREIIALVGGHAASAQAAWMRPANRSAATQLPGPRGDAKPPSVAPRGAHGTQPGGSPPSVAHSVVVGQHLPATPAPEPELPYPLRHVRYAENVTMLLRSIARRDRLFDDVADSRELKARLWKSLDECADLLELIRRRSRR